MKAREQVKQAAKQAGMELQVFMVRFAAPWDNQPAVICEAHTVAAARMIAEAEHPGMHLAEVKAIGGALKCACGIEVADGQNGYVSGPPPWSDEVIVTCYACENAAMEEGERDWLLEAAYAEERVRGSY